MERFPAPALALLLPLLLPAATAPAPASGAVAFGDSGWVAPLAVAHAAGDPTAPGPRVADGGGTHWAETALRLPFRAAFLPLRVFARGLELGAGVAAPQEVTTAFGVIVPPVVLRPVVQWSGSSGPGGGVNVIRHSPSGAPSPWSVSALYTLEDTRRVHGLYTLGAPGGMAGFMVEGQYGLQPNRRFYGLGNFSSDQRTVFLMEEGRVDVALRLGRRPDREVRLLAGWSDVSVRRGYHDTPLAAEVPFLERGAEAVSYGIAADLGALDDLADPSRGVRGRGEVRHVRSIDGADFDHTRWHVEGRAYLPVFALRRVLAFRAVHVHVDGGDDAGGVPFYHQPETAGDLRFPAYANHRFRDRHLAFAQVEYRWTIWERVRAFALVQAGQVASTSQRLRVADVHESWGGGLRFAAGERTALRLEVAKGDEGVASHLVFRGDF